MENVTPDITDYLYGCIISISSELDRFQKRTNHSEAEDKLITEVDPTTPEVRQQTEPTPGVGSE